MTRNITSCYTVRRSSNQNIEQYNRKAYEMQRNSRRIEVGWEKPRRKGVTAIARRLGYSKTYVSQVLAGKLKPGAPLAAKLKRLGVEVA